MLLFRSEADVEAWCRGHERPRGAVLPVAQAAELGRHWFGDRLDPDWRPRTTEAAQRVLAAVGLHGPFWRLPAEGSGG